MLDFQKTTSNMLRSLLVLFIKFYQRFISPVKRYRCAYGVLHSNGTCSSRIKEIVKTAPFNQIFKLTLQQFANCHLAYQQLNANDNDDNQGRCILLSDKKAKEKSSTIKEEKREQKDNAGRCTLLPSYKVSDNDEDDEKESGNSESKEVEGSCKKYEAALCCALMFPFGDLSE